MEFAPHETKTLRDEVVLPDDGRGIARVRADYFTVRDRAQFEAIDNSSRPALTNYYALALDES